MAEFNMVIDTEPMAAVMTTVGAGVMGVTGAVVAMQSAVVAQEEESARTISENVDRGFYMLMKSQISQKMAAEASQISSKLLLMKKFRADILRMKEIMTSDYNRIYRRYKKQFTSLDKELHTRVQELDRSAVEISDVYKHFCDNRKDMSASLYLSGDEAIKINTIESSAAVKSKTLSALNAMYGNIQSTLKYNSDVSHILFDESAPSLPKEAESGAEESYVSALVTEAMSMFDKDSSVENVYLPRENFSGVEAVEREVRQVEGRFEWKESNLTDREKVKKAFNKEIETNSPDERVAQEMRRLFDEGVWAVPSKEEGQTTEGGLERETASFAERSGAKLGSEHSERSEV